MENTLLRMAIVAAAMLAFWALPSLAAAATVVPPGNSAATQYTETFPTTGGNAEVNSPINGTGLSPRGSKRSPEKVLGSQTAEKLESHGQDGETVAALATETAPVSGAEENGSGGGGGARKEKGGGAAKAEGRVGLGGSVVVSRDPVTVAAPEGSSGLSEVLGHATGSSSGEMGLFLPLVLLAAPLFALAYAWRRRNSSRAAS